MYCEYCHGEISPSHDKCPICGKPVKPKASSCPNCGHGLEAGAACCDACGYHLLLKKVIKLQDGGHTQPAKPQAVVCSNCKKEIAASSRFCEYCGADVHVEAPSNAKPATQKQESNASSSSSPVLMGFNEKTFYTLIKLLDSKGVISMDELKKELSK